VRRMERVKKWRRGEEEGGGLVGTCRNLIGLGDLWREKDKKIKK
jgi:hypothetical protein